MSSSPTRSTPLATLADLAPWLLLVTAGMFGLAALAEVGRYLILLHNRTRLIAPLLVRLSDASVVTFAGLALPVALAAALACLGWLVETRRSAFERAGQAEPRGVRMMMVGCLVPVVNLVAPGVLLTELARRTSPRMVRVVRVWWCGWVLGAVMSVVAVLCRWADSLQAKADGVLFTALTDVVAAGVALLSLWVIREASGRDVFGRVHRPKRLLAALGPVEPVIEPIRPRAAQPDSTGPADEREGVVAQ